MVDALASGASTRKGVEVRVLSWAPTHLKQPIDIMEIFVNIVLVGSTIGSTNTDDKKLHD